VSARKPRAVLPGDRIAIVAPASPFAREEFECGVAELQRLGYEPVYDETVFAREGAYLAGSPEVRARALMRHWDDPSVAAIVAARGGFGSVHVLPLLDVGRVRAAPKLFVGYSDNTSILSWLTAACGIPALHGPMIEGRLANGAEGYDERSFLAMMQGRGEGLELRPAALETVRHGDVNGPMFGGTLTQVAASLGTPYALEPPAGCVLFLEDVNERPYKLDRLLTQLKLSGLLARARALVFGEMRGCDEPGAVPPLGARDVVERFAREFEGPVLFGFPSGHTTGPCWTIPLGVRVRVRTRPYPALVVEESPVE
jgi:muramoyltetrapeptide carboxypeptidase